MQIDCSNSMHVAPHREEEIVALSANHGDSDVEHLWLVWVLEFVEPALVLVYGDLDRHAVLQFVGLLTALCDGVQRFE